MRHIEIDEYVMDVLLPDLAGHDRAPNAFLIYLVIWARLFRGGERRAALSLRQLAENSGLSKSAVQKAVARLHRRGLVVIHKASATAVPEYELPRHWLRRRANAWKRSAARPTMPQ
ncbi:MAG: helix-turn-helix domain-containing protein [Bryobacteraceae bacterium]|nr:helix-turn-helix domain-containing protein [Bryobacteraceae bacterium]